MLLILVLEAYFFSYNVLCPVPLTNTYACLDVVQAPCPACFVVLEWVMVEVSLVIVGVVVATSFGGIH